MDAKGAIICGFEDYTLVVKFNIQEVETTLNAMDDDKALGCDGFNTLFF